MKQGGKRVGKVRPSVGMRRVRADSPTRSRLRQGARPKNEWMEGGRHNKKRLPHGKDSRLFNNITNFQILLFRLIGVVVGFVGLDKLLEYNGKLYTTVLSTSGSSLVGCHRLSLTVSFRLQAV